MALLRDLADYLASLGFDLWKAGRATVALSAFDQERPVRQRLTASEPTNTPLRNDLANCETHAAAALLTLGRLSDSQACCGRAIAIREELVKTRFCRAPNLITICEPIPPPSIRNVAQRSPIPDRLF